MRTTARHRLADAIAVLAALVVGVGILLRSPTPPSPAPPESGPPLAGWSARGPEPARWTDLTWGVGDKSAFDLPGNTYVEDAVAWHDGFVAVGYTVLTDGSNGVRAQVWTSKDGHDWTRQPVDWDGRVFNRILADASGLTIVGIWRGPIRDTQGPTRLGWWTSKDGVAWTESPLPLQLFDGQVLRAAGEAGDRWLVQTGSDGGGDTWFRRTAGRWERLDLGSSFHRANLAGMIGSRDGWLAFGEFGFDGGGSGIGQRDDPTDDRGAIWRSADGEHWQRANIIRPGTGITLIARAASGWIALGSDHEGCPRCVGRAVLLWRSDDGQTWTPMDIPAASSNGFGGTLVTGDGGRALAFDTLNDGRLRIRDTSDGRGWHDVHVWLAPPLRSMDVIPIRAPVMGAGAVITFDHNSLPEGPEHVWVVPYVARPGAAPDGAVSQAVPPPPGSQDRPCLPAGQECG